MVLVLGYIALVGWPAHQALSAAEGHVVRWPFSGSPHHLNGQGARGRGHLSRGAWGNSNTDDMVVSKIGGPQYRPKIL